MHKNWPLKLPHHPDSWSSGSLADILIVKIENVNRKVQEYSSSGKEFIRWSNGRKRTQEKDN